MGTFLISKENEECPHFREPAADLPVMGLGEHVVQDYEAIRLSLKAHPMALLRAQFPRAVVASRLAALRPGQRVELAGLVLVRQRPGTAKGVIFVTIEDETGVANLIVRPPIFERFRRIVLGSRLIAVKGRVEREGIVIHVMADELTDRSSALSLLTATEAMPMPLARADEVRRPGRDPREVLPKGRSFR